MTKKKTTQILRYIYTKKVYTSKSFQPFLATLFFFFLFSIPSSSPLTRSPNWLPRPLTR